MCDFDNSHATMSSSEYSNYTPRVSIISPIYESDDDITDEVECHEIDSSPNEEPCTVPTFFRNPVLAHGRMTQHYSTSVHTVDRNPREPEYTAPFGILPRSPKNMLPFCRTQEKPTNGFVPSVSKFQPKMGVLVTRNQTQQSPKTPTLQIMFPDSNNSWNANCDQNTFNPYHVLEMPLPSNGLCCTEDIDSPVYDSTQYIVTPIRRQNYSECSNKSTDSRHSVSKNECSCDLGNIVAHTKNSKRQCQEIREHWQSEECEANLTNQFTHQALLQQHYEIFADSNHRCRIMSEPELNHIRDGLLRQKNCKNENSVDSFCMQDLLLSKECQSKSNGNGRLFLDQDIPLSHCECNSAPTPLDRLMHGSGVVFRRRRRPCWCVLLLVVAATLVATGLSIGILFGVIGRKNVKKFNSSILGKENDKDNNNLSKNISGKFFSSKKMSTNKSEINIDSPSSYLNPIALPTGNDNPDVKLGFDGQPSDFGTSVHRFKTYWHPGDSRIMEMLLNDRNVLRVSGYKANNGSFLGLYSLSLSDKNGRTTRVRFLGGRSLASIILPDGTVVALDWSANQADLECKIFQIPPPRGAPENNPDGIPNKFVPHFHFVTLKLGVHSYIFRQIFQTLQNVSLNNVHNNKASDDNTNTSMPLKICFPRMPVKVSKCDGEYPYNGAFVQGEVTTQTGPTLFLDALPWHVFDVVQNCYSSFQDKSPNFYIPLPGHVEQTLARDIASRFWRTAASWWFNVCSIIGTLLDGNRERRDSSNFSILSVCSKMAENSRSQLSHGSLYDIVFQSCFALLTTLHLSCTSLFSLAGRLSANLPIAPIGVRNKHSSVQPFSPDTLRTLFANSTSLQEPSTSPEQEVIVKALAFCPSTQPILSQQKSVKLTEIPISDVLHKSVNINDIIYIDCQGNPELTYAYLGHAAAVFPLTTLKHRLKVCAVCAFEKSFHVSILEDDMCCNDTCSHVTYCEKTRNNVRLHVGHTEKFTFEERKSVYCYEFLTEMNTKITQPLRRQCLGGCDSSFTVRFQIKDSMKNKGLRLEDESRVYIDQQLKCIERHHTTCKSTFGH